MRNRHQAGLMQRLARRMNVEPPTIANGQEILLGERGWISVFDMGNFAIITLAPLPEPIPAQIKTKYWLPAADWFLAIVNRNDESLEAETGEYLIEALGLKRVDECHERLGATTAQRSPETHLLRRHPCWRQRR